jgi:hypothetical protein
MSPSSSIYAKVKPSHRRSNAPKPAPMKIAMIGFKRQVLKQ